MHKIDLDCSKIDYFKKCEILNTNPVLTARHFQFRVKTFFKEIIVNKNSPLGAVVNYVIKVEFQFRGSPHIHSFIWIKDPPELTKETKEEYIKFIDSVVRADLPHECDEPKLYELVNKYQIHCHSRSCRKYKNIPCRFHYGRFFTDHTICAEPLSSDMSETDKVTILTKRSKLLKEVKLYIDEYPDPHKTTYKVGVSIAEILEQLEIPKEEYYLALSISPDQDFEICADLQIHVLLIITLESV